MHRNFEALEPRLKENKPFKVEVDGNLSINYNRVSISYEKNILPSPFTEFHNYLMQFFIYNQDIDILKLKVRDLLRDDTRTFKELQYALFAVRFLTGMRTLHIML